MSAPGAGSADLPARTSGDRLDDLIAHSVGETITIANEFTEVTVRRVDTRNGSRLLVTSPKSGQWISLDALEIEALTWQNTYTLSAMVGNMHAPLLSDDSDLP
ncbi:dihydrodiol dehydrogenase [Mycolicibacter minnesotensis]